MRFAFVGAPEFAARVLTQLDEIGRRPCLVVSQPDRPKGRGRKTSPPPVIKTARELGLPQLQVEDINASDAVAAIAASGATTLVLAAFGQILSPATLQSFLCLNVHASLLPAHRGAAPVERALAAGDDETGVSIMLVSERLDEGPWALQSRLSVGLRDDAGSVIRSLTTLGASGIDQVLTGLADGNLRWTPQGEGATYAAKLSPADMVMDASRSALELHNLVRSLSPEIGARITLRDLNLKIWRTWPFGGPGLDAAPEPLRSTRGRSGEVKAIDGRLFLVCDEGLLELLLVQPAGKGRMPAADLLRGYASRLHI